MKLSCSKQELACVFIFLIQLEREFQDCFLREDNIPGIHFKFEYSLKLETDEISVILVPVKNVVV